MKTNTVTNTVTNTLLPVCAVGMLLVLLGQQPVVADAAVRFNRDIRPILSSNCFQCHGPDEHDRQADLRLDTADGIRQAFQADSLDETPGWGRINSTDPDEKMPPADSHRELTVEQIALLKDWIEAGAAWEGHWSFVPPTAPAVPQVRRGWWPHNPIDNFVLAQLERERITPSPQADRETLIRRVTLDLTGLPPTLAEIDQFLADRDPRAYEKVVDRLLASEAYGERMAVAWLDAARYGDTSVFHADGKRDMWPWRNWVISSFNQNLPFDQFTIQQLAGDLLPDATHDTRVASGFNRNNATTDEGGAIAEEFRVEYAVDRVNTTATVWMALTLQCAQCHDHKYDPISQEEYYQFFAYFNQASDPGMQTRGGNQSPIVDVFDPQRTSKVEAEQAKLADLTQRIEQFEAAADGPFATWLSQVTHESSESPDGPSGAQLVASFDRDGQPTEVDRVPNSQSDRLDFQGKAIGKPTKSDGRVGQGLAVDAKRYVEFPAAGDFERDQAFSFGAWVRMKPNQQGALVSRMDDGNAHRGFDLLVTKKGRLEVHVVNQWPDNAIKVFAADGTVKHDAWQHVLAVYDGSSKAAGLKVYVNGKAVKLEAEKDQLTATIRTEQPLRLGRRSTGYQLTGTLDEVRVYAKALTEAEVTQLAAQGPLTDWMLTPIDKRTASQRARLKQHYLETHNGNYQQLVARVQQQTAVIEKLQQPISTVMVMQDLPKPRMTYVLDRGNYDSPLEDRPVNPTTMRMLPGLPEGAPANRLGMAKWLVQDDHPLTARVAVNRYWELLFGEGLVKTSDDFGSQGDWPSHPALLDWLAVDFKEHGWDVKRALKQMVMSATYRQSSRVRDDLRERDPGNRLLARAPRFRLQAEFVRDNALSVSGLFVNRVGGPSVKPYQPEGLWNEVSLDGNLRFKQDHGDALYRRSLYIYWRRSAPPPSMTLFDAPSREKCVIRRSRTNTPLQALVTLNDVQYVEAARALAERVIKLGGATLDERLSFAFRTTTGRYPSATKLAVLRETYEQEHKLFSADRERAKQWLSHGESKRDEAIDVVDHAAMTIVTSMLLNLDETLTRG